MKEFFSNIIEVAIKLIATIQWYDILDIALVAAALYYIIKLLRQTRAFQLIKGIAFLGIVYFIVSTFNMSASSYFLSRIFSDIVIVIILLFQPEIRHTIESFGRGDFKRFSLFSSRGSNLYEEEVKSIVANVAKACSNMSDEKVGALIVFEGKSLLGEYIETGSEVDSKISSIILENIFFPKSPLHDGAVIVRDNRVCAAGCILPLTQSEISAELGTRHRAALGMSEHSDALTIVVSEETGSISVAVNGSLERNITNGELIEILTDFLTLDDSENVKLFRNLRRKK